MMEKNILATLTIEQKKFLMIKSVKKGEILFRESTNCDSISIVISGEIKISSHSFEGNEIIYNILVKNDVFGNNLIFSDTPFYKGDVTATEDSVIVIITKDKLLNIFQTNKEFLIAYLNVQSNFGKKLNSTIKMLSLNSAEDRFRYYLFSNNGIIKFTSITNLANILNLQRETLSRLLSRLEKENIISRSPHKIVLINH